MVSPVKVMAPFPLQQWHGVLSNTLTVVHLPRCIFFSSGYKLQAVRTE